MDGMIGCETGAPPNQSMKPTAPFRDEFSVFATTPRPWLISFSWGRVECVRFA